MGKDSAAGEVVVFATGVFRSVSSEPQKVCWGRSPLGDMTEMTRSRAASPWTRHPGGNDKSIAFCQEWH